MVPYGRLLLAPVEGWWPSATWRALRALWIAVKKNLDPNFIYRGPPLYPPCRCPPYPLHRVFLFYLFIFTPIFFIGSPFPPPPPLPPPLPLAQSIYYYYVTEGRGGKEGREGKEGTRLFCFVLLPPFFL